MDMKKCQVSVEAGITNSTRDNLEGFTEEGHISFSQSFIEMTFNELLPSIVVDARSIIMNKERWSPCYHGTYSCSRKWIWLNKCIAAIYNKCSEGKEQDFL